MPAEIIDGKAVAAKWHRQAAERAARLERECGVRPCLGVILVGDNPASVSYVTAKERACAADGILSRPLHMKADATQEEVLEAVRSLASDPAVHGILVQLPLPRNFDPKAVINAIPPENDVDGFTNANAGKLLNGEDCLLPCTPHGIVRLLVDCGVETDGAHAVVVGRSNIVGRPLANLLARKGPGGNATVTLCHTGTRDLASFTRQADILIVASGHPQTVTGDMVKPGATVIDVGVNRIPDPSAKRGYRLAGDVDFASVSQVAARITPVPGGVGPLTIAMLMLNTVEAAERLAR